jgi:hypothetical protein
MAVLVAMIKDVRWLLAVAWPFFALGAWGLLRGMPSKLWRRTLIAVVSLAIGGGLAWMYIALKPSISDTAKPLPAIAVKSANSNSAQPPKSASNAEHRSTPTTKAIQTAAALRSQLRRVVIEMSGCLAKNGGETAKLDSGYWIERMDEKTRQELEMIRKGVVADCVQTFSADLYGARNALKDAGMFDENLDIDFGIATELFDHGSMGALMLRFEQIAMG